jgi:hypothetical protein
LTTGTNNAVRISVAGLSADITSNDTTVTDWVSRYFGSWWNAAPPADGTAAVHVSATIDSHHTQHIANQIDRTRHETVQYARKPMRLVHDHGSVLAHDGHVAYHVMPDGPITIAGHDAGRVASAASRLAREALRGRLATVGWVLLHASAVVDHHTRAWVAFGSKAAGKTSTALQLARASRWSILANDRLFARSNQDGDIEVLPWPAAAAIGLGILTAGGWYETIAAARDQLHSSTPDEMLAALAAGVREPMQADGRELKAQLFPDQLTSLLGIPLATTAKIGSVLLPTIDSRAQHATIKPSRRLLTAERNAFHADIEDRYPPIWGLRQNETPRAQAAVFEQINKLSHWALTLTHNIESNEIALATLTNSPQRG